MVVHIGAGHRRQVGLRTNEVLCLLGPAQAQGQSQVIDDHVVRLGEHGNRLGDLIFIKQLGQLRTLPARVVGRRTGVTGDGRKHTSPARAQQGRVAHHATKQRVPELAASDPILLKLAAPVIDATHRAQPIGGPLQTQLLAELFEVIVSFDGDVVALAAIEVDQPILHHLAIAGCRDHLQLVVQIEIQVQGVGIDVEGRRTVEVHVRFLARQAQIRAAGGEAAVTGEVAVGQVRRGHVAGRCRQAGWQVVAVGRRADV